MPPRSRGDLMSRRVQSKSTSDLAATRATHSNSTSTSTSTSAANTPDPSTRASTSSSSAGPAFGERSVWTGLTTGPSSSSTSLSLDTSIPSTAADDAVQPPIPSSSSSSSTSDSDSTPLSNLPHASSLYSLHSRSHTYLGPAAFAPPFYNRPPTPLPPSPSLTSLLRPSFSAAPSRRASPERDSSDNEPHAGSSLHIGQGLPSRAASQTRSTAVLSTLTSSFRTARPVPLASPKVPTYEYYGFTLYLGSSLAFVMYLLWAFLPSPFLHQLGIHYYPNRWWALAVPAWLVMGLVWVYVALAGWNVERETLGLTDLRTLVDGKGQVARVEGRGRKGAATTGRRVVDGAGDAGWRAMWSEGTDAVMDIPIGGVCEVLYGEGREDDDELGG